MKVKSLWKLWKLWNSDLRPFSWLKRVVNFVSTGLGCHFWYVCDNIEMFWWHRSVRRAAASQTCCLQRATWDNVGCWLLEGLFSGWLCLSEAWTRCEYPEEIRPTASDNKTTVPQSFVALFSSSSYEVFLLRLFKFAKVQEFSSSSVSAQVLSCKEVALCLQLLTTQHLQTLMSWMMEKLQTWSLDLEKV